MAVDPRVAFGSNVRTARAARGLSQERLAEASGLDRTYVSGVERGIRNPSLVNICRLAGALGCHTNDLFSGVDVLPPRERSDS